MALSVNGANRMLVNFIGTGTLYLSLHHLSAPSTQTPTASNELIGSGGSANATGYTRAAAAASVWTVDAAAHSVQGQSDRIRMRNNADVAFPTPTADWTVTPNFYGIWTAQTGGSLLFHDELTSSVLTAPSGSIVEFPSNQLEIYIEV